MGMINVGNKPKTYRNAIAQAIICLDSSTIHKIKDGISPKGNIFETARVAATMGTKRTSELIPYCHQIPIDGIDVDFIVGSNDIKIIVNVHSIWNTGVEMESLTGASVAALTIYDMLKPLDPSLTIESLKIIEKHGGVSDFQISNDIKYRAVVIVVSDSRTIDSDKSGKIIINMLKSHGFNIVGYKLIVDDLSSIEKELKYYCDEDLVDIILTTGGTGIGPRDVTPEATKRVLEKDLDGIVESLRNYGQQRTPLSMLSRGIAGIRGSTIIINLPGSTNGVSQSLNALFPWIIHAFEIIAGKNHTQH